MVTRTDPPLPLARLRAGGQLAELRSADLRFTLEETAAFLAEIAGADVPERRGAAARANRGLGGWCSSQRSRFGETDPAGFVATFCGSHRYMMDYLTEEVLARQTEDVVSFLLETSVLERLCGPVCDALTGRTDGQETLERLDAAGLFLIPLDEERQWWRYHQLFADLLRVRLQHERGERARDLHAPRGDLARRAWLPRRSPAPCGSRQSGVDGPARRAERRGLLRRSEGATLGGWLSTLPAETLRTRPRLGLARAVKAAVESDPKKLDSLLADAEGAFATIGDEPHKPSVERRMSVLTNIPAAISFLRADLARLAGDADAAVAADETALGYLSEHDWLLSSHVRWNLGVAGSAVTSKRRRSLAVSLPSGGPPAKVTSRCGSPTTSATCSALAGAWAPHSTPTNWD